MSDALIELTESVMADRGIDYSPEAWDAITAELLDTPEVTR